MLCMYVHTVGAHIHVDVQYDRLQFICTVLVIHKRHTA